jgi:hypothetical protein
MILSDYPFSESELRAILTKVLYVRCSFPSFPFGSSGSTIRCILEQEEDEEEEGGKALDPVFILEDIICKVMPKSASITSSDPEQFLSSFPLKKYSVSESLLL